MKYFFIHSQKWWHTYCLMIIVSFNWELNWNNSVPWVTDWIHYWLRVLKSKSIFFFKLLIGGKLFYSVVLVSAISQFSSVQSLSHVRLFATPWTAASQASLSITNSWSLLKPMPIELVMPAIQPSHPLSPPSPPALDLSQHQGLFQWVSSSHEVAKVLEFQLQHQSFQWTPRTDGSPSGWTGWNSLQSQGLSRVFSNTTVQKHHSSVLSFHHSPTLTSIHDYWKKHSLN